MLHWSLPLVLYKHDSRAQCREQRSLPLLTHNYNYMIFRQLHTRAIASRTPAR
jgi:hypothetical protein